MRPMTLQRSAAPSPLVLNFLRSQVQHAFDGAPVVQCARAKAPTRGMVTLREGAGFETTCARRAWRPDVPATRIHDSHTTGHMPTHLLPAPLAATFAARRAPHLSLARDPNLRRTFSTSSTNTFWGWLGWGRRPAYQQLESPGRISESSSDGHSNYDHLGRMTRSVNELKMRCTELDEHGNVTMVSGEFKKSELIAKYGLLPRDLRKIDSSLLPNVLIRPTAILINLLHIRALIKHNRVLVFDAYGTKDSKSQSVFMYDLDLKLRQKESAIGGFLAYEFRALEAVLISVTLALEKEFEGVSEPVVRVLKELEEDIDRDKLRYLLVYSKKLGTFEQKARLVRDALSELLEADDDLTDMYLSAKAEGKPRVDDDHTEVEMLLESYHKVADEIVNAAENLVSSIRNTEEIVKAILDANRNSLMLLDIKFSIITLSITAGTFVAALYGMNLKNAWEETDFGFWVISAWCTMFGALVAVYGLKKLRKVQLLSMWGRRGAREKSLWGLWVSGPSMAPRQLPVDARDMVGDIGEGLRSRRLRGMDSMGDIIRRDRLMARFGAEEETRMQADTAIATAKKK